MPDPKRPEPRIQIEARLRRADGGREKIDHLSLPASMRPDVEEVFRTLRRASHERAIEELEGES